MKSTGKLRDVTATLDGRILCTFQLNDKEVLHELADMDTNAELDIEVKKHRKKRSLDANAMLWACIGDIATKINGDKWEIYLNFIKRQNKFTYMKIRSDALETMKGLWRELEVIQESNGWADVLCYYGSSTYDSKEFSVLLEDVLDEMKRLNIQPPPPKSVMVALEQWEKRKAKS